MKWARLLAPSLIRKAAMRSRCSLAEFLLKIPEGDPIDREWDAMPLVG